MPFKYKYNADRPMTSYKYTEIISESHKPHLKGGHYSLQWSEVFWSSSPYYIKSRIICIFISFKDEEVF